MNQKQIQITIDQEGNISMQMKGYKGNGCMSDALQLIKKVGAKSVQSQKKKQYYQKCEDKNEQRLNEQ